MFTSFVHQKTSSKGDSHRILRKSSAFYLNDIAACGNLSFFADTLNTDYGLPIREWCVTFSGKAELEKFFNQNQRNLDANERLKICAS